MIFHGCCGDADGRYGSHVLDDRFAKGAAREQRCLVHQALKVVGHGLVGNRPFHALDNEVGGFGPTHVAKHHFCGEDEGARVDLVLTRVLWCRSVRGLEDRDARVVVDVRSGCDTDTADLRRQGVRDVIAVEVHGAQDAVLRRTGDDLLKHGVSDDVFDDDGVARVGVLEGAPRATVQLFCTELFLRQGVTPVPETAFGEFHDVAFVDEGDAWFVVVNGVLDG